MNEIDNTKWYNKPTFVIIFLILFFPIGLYLMWKNKMWSNKVRWGITIFIAIIGISNYGKTPSSSSFSSNSCKLSGCNQKAQGWHHDLESAEMRQAGLYGADRIAEKGGYCSRDHAYEDNKIKRAN
jgi:hypothetical protein